MFYMLLTLPLYASPLLPPVMDTLDKTQINWTAFRLEAKSTYTSRAQSWEYRESLASQGAGDLLKRHIIDVPLQAEKTVEDLLSNPEYIRYLQDGMHEWKTYETHYMAASNSVQVVGYINLQRYLRKVIIEHASSDISEEKGEYHTGMIIDARGLSFQPVVMPKVIDAEGIPVVDISGFSANAAQDTLPVRYVSTPADPICAKTVGKKPAIMRASDVEKGSLILDASTVLPSIEDLSAIVSTGNVVIVVDSP